MQSAAFPRGRGTVAEMTEAGALAHLDGLSVKYVGRGPYFGACVPAELSAREFPVLCRIAPTRVITLNAGSAADNVNFSKPLRVVPATAGRLNLISIWWRDPSTAC